MFDPSDEVQKRFSGYGPARIPDLRDDELSSFVSTLVEGGPPMVANLMPTVTDKSRQVLRAYSERMASLSVRRGDARLLAGATIALVVGGLDENRLESLMIMVLIEDSVTRLNVDLAGLFEEVSRVVGHPGTVNLMIWLTRSPDDRTLASMGFVAGEDEGGFRYRLDW